MTRRPGISLTEVIVALFIMGLGVIAILTMFPLAASQMAIAVREDRGAQSAINADAYLRAYWKTQVVEQNGGGEPFYNALTDPDSLLPLTAKHGLLPANSNEWSYPVLVEPMGWVARGGNGNQPSSCWLGDSGVTNVPRWSLNQITNNDAAPYPLALRSCSLMDNLGYTDNGVPTADREMRYNWLWVVQRPPNQGKYNANMTVVVFDRRAHLYAPPGSEGVYANTTFTPGQTAVSISWGAGQSAPDVKQGGWVMDATINGTVREANFYRVVSVNPGATATSANLELQTPVKTQTNGGTGQYVGTLVVLRGVSGVYVRSPLTPTN